VFVSATFFSGSFDWHRRHVTYVAPRRAFVQQIQPVNRERRGEWRDRRVEGSRPVSSFNHVQQAQAASRFQERKLLEQRPIVQGAQLPRDVERRESRREQRGEWRDQRREHRAEAPRQVVVQNQVQQAQVARPMVQAAQVPPQMQRPAQYRVEAPRHQAQASRPAVQGGQGQQRGQGHQHRGGRG
jgi:hypothetical protein